MSFLLSPLGRVLGSIAVALMLLGLAWVHGYRAGAASERTAVLSRSIDVLRERNKVDDQIKGMDDARLCRALGGMPDECAGLGL
ncbi:hypothetical protein ACFPLB_04420 [Aquamicrobium segne]|uniref:Uncharacterized protein n=1 Tax=Aquamicrobium segne TaxID=469547 RepID=A0ABW0GUN7_9HYPH